MLFCVLYNAGSNRRRNVCYFVFCIMQVVTGEDGKSAVLVSLTVSTHLNFQNKYSFCIVKIMYFQNRQSFVISNSCIFKISSHLLFQMHVFSK
jgi:hypothetical protein